MRSRRIYQSMVVFSADKCNEISTARTPVWSVNAMLDCHCRFKCEFGTLRRQRIVPLFLNTDLNAVYLVLS